MSSCSSHTGHAALTARGNRFASDGAACLVVAVVTVYAQALTCLHVQYDCNACIHGVLCGLAGSDWWRCRCTQTTHVCTQTAVPCSRLTHKTACRHTHAHTHTHPCCVHRHTTYAHTTHSTLLAQRKRTCGTRPAPALSPPAGACRRLPCTSASPLPTPSSLGLASCTLCSALAPPIFAVCFGASCASVQAAHVISPASMPPSSARVLLLSPSLLRAPLGTDPLLLTSLHPPLLLIARH